jgi:chaperonin GroEL (HSP60 family)
MDKMLIDESGGVTITDDGATVIEQLAFEHPFADLVSNVGLSQRAETGDGATTAVIVATELMRQVTELLDQGLHPTQIVGGFRRANTIAQEELDELTYEVGSGDDQLLRQVVASRLVGLVSGEAKATLADEIATVVEDITAKTQNEHADHIAVEATTGRFVGDHEIIPGATIEKSPLQKGMPTDFETASILLLNEPLEVDESEQVSDAGVESRATYDEYVAHEDGIRQEQADEIIDAGADVVFCQKSVDKGIADRLAAEEILVTEFTIKPDVQFLARLLDVPVRTGTDGLSPEDLGEASIRYDDEANRFYIETTDPAAKTIFVRGSTQSVRRKLENSVEDAVNVAVRLVTDGRVVPGAGATEAGLARRIREAAPAVATREQIAIEAFADALEEIPRVLARNAALDPIDSIAALRSAHTNGRGDAGIDVLRGGTIDTLAEGIVDLTATKSEAIVSATEAANIVAHIDDVVPASDLS